jgi:hypothetical protein
MEWSPFRALFSWLGGILFWRAMTRNWRDDSVYKENLQRLIERNREFEEARKSKEARNEPHS